MAKEMLSKIKTWKEADGTVRTTVFVKDAMAISVKYPLRPGQGERKVVTTTWEFLKKAFSQTFIDQCEITPLETEDQFIERVCTAIKAERVEHAVMEEKVVEKDSLPVTKDGEKLKVDADGKYTAVKDVKGG